MSKVNRIEKVENLSRTSRLTRVFFGAALIGSIMNTSVSPLGWLAVLPLLAIYPLFSALTGWSPLKALINRLRLNTVADTQLSVSARVAFGVVGAAAIGSVYVVSGPVGGFAVLPLLGIYPVFAAIIGEEPINALLAQPVVSQETVAHTESVTEHVEHHVEYRHAA